MTEIYSENNWYFIEIFLWELVFSSMKPRNCGLNIFSRKQWLLCECSRVSMGITSRFRNPFPIFSLPKLPNILTPLFIKLLIAIRLYCVNIGNSSRPSYHLFLDHYLFNHLILALSTRLFILLTSDLQPMLLSGTLKTADILFLLVYLRSISLLSSLSLLFLRNEEQ